jgi:hypothetical protein
MISVHPDSLLFGADCDRLHRLIVCERRSRVSFHGMIERHFCMMLATCVISLAAMIGGSAMALCRVLVFLSRCGVGVNYMGVFVHGMLLICVPDRFQRSMLMILVQHSLQHVDSRRRNVTP